VKPQCFDIIEVMGNTVGRSKSLVLSQRNLVIGSLLGDGRLECRSKGIRSEKTARFRTHHGEKQKDYVLWKYKILQNIVGAAPRRIVRFDKNRAIDEASYYFHTFSLEGLGRLHSLFYKGGPKSLPSTLHKILNPEVLAVWYMDDGSYTKNGCTISTHSFSLNEQKELIRAMKQIFGVNVALLKDRKQHKLRIGSKDFSKFRKIVKPFIIPSMSYKI
jgi:hypothetical protein